MTRRTVKRLTKLLDEPEREFQRLRRVACRLQQNKSLAISGRNLFDDEASTSNITGVKPPTPPRTLREHSHPNSVGLRNEDPLHHVKHYLSIVDNIQADGTTKDTPRLRFLHLSLKGKAAKWFDRIPPSPAQIMTWNQLVSPFLDYFFPNDDTLPWGNNKRKEIGEYGPEWVVRSKFEDELANFMLKKKSHAKGIGDMLDQHRKELHKQFSQILSTIRKNETPELEAPTFSITTRSRISTQDPPFPTLPQSTSANHIEGETEKEGPEDTEPSIIQESTPRPFIFYQPSKSSNLPFPSRLKKQKNNDEGDRLLSIFKQIHINLTFLEAMIHMPKGAKESTPKRRRSRKLHTAMSYRTLSSQERPF
ncbi:hypothetical protein Tco_0557953 [Tanacetum coccineum]